MEPWRGMRDAYLDAWSKSMVEMVNSEAYAQATGAMLDTYLTVSTPFREAVEKAMLKTLEQLAMPSRADIVSIAERMTNIEMRLDDLDAKLDEMHKADSETRPGTVAASAPPSGKESIAAEQESRPVQTQRRRGRSRMAQATGDDRPVYRGGRSAEDAHQGDDHQGRDCANSERVGLGAEQGQALSLHARCCPPKSAIPFRCCWSSL